MARSSQAQEQTMVEIVASIRRMISDDGGSAAAVQSGARPVRPQRRASGFFSDGARPAEADAAEPQVDNVIELAIAQAMEDARIEVAAEAAAEAAVAAAVGQPPAAPADSSPAATDAETPAPVSSTPAVAESRAVAESLAEDDRSQPLLSPTADVAVAGAFNRLAAAMLSRSARPIDELAEDLLRPLLRNWLDQNLPPMVERLVREEIERVSRGRR
jgi:hypothetical protein